MSITTKLWGWALLVAGLVLASWAWSPTVYADPDHSPAAATPHQCAEHHDQLNDNLRSACRQLGLVDVAPSQPVNTGPTQAECDSNFGGLTPQQQALCAVAGINTSGKPAENTIRNLIRSIVSVLAWIAGTAAVIVIIVQGMRMVFSSGDSTAFGNARNGIVYALVGLMIAVLAPHLVRYILSLLG